MQKPLNGYVPGERIFCADFCDVLRVLTSDDLRATLVLQKSWGERQELEILRLESTCDHDVATLGLVEYFCSKHSPRLC